MGECQAVLCKGCVRDAYPLSLLLTEDSDGGSVVQSGCSATQIDYKFLQTEHLDLDIDRRCVLCLAENCAKVVSGMAVPLCVKCAAIVHNAKVLYGIISRPEWERVDPGGVSVLPAAECNNLRLFPLAPVASQPIVPRTRSSPALRVDGPLHVRSSLLPSGVGSLSVISKRLILPAMRDWLVDLTSSVLHDTAVLPSRLQRIHCVEQDTRPIDFSLRLELLHVVLDFIHAVKSHNAWHVPEALRHPHLYDVCLLAPARHRAGGRDTFLACDEKITITHT